MLERLLPRPFRRRIMRAQRRMYEAASARPRAEAWGRTPNIALAATRDTAAIRPRTRHLVINNPVARRMADQLTAQLVGDGISIQSEGEDPDLRAMDAAWSAWEPRADADGLRSFDGLLAAMVWSLIVDGESFAHLLVGDDGELRIRLLPAEMVDTGYTEQLANGHAVLAGVEHDANGVRVAYWVRQARPSNPFAASFERRRIPAGDMVHLFRPDEPGQCRGVSWLAPVVALLTDMDSYHDARLMQAKVAALLSGIVKDPDGTVTRAMTGGVPGPIADVSLEPGSFTVLHGDASIEAVTPPNYSDNGEFVKAHLRMAAGVAGLSYEQLSGDLVGATYSSIRAAAVDNRRQLEQWQHNLLIHQVCRPIRERWVRLRALAGAPELAGFAEDPERFLAFKAIPAGWPWVDPLKDVQAAALAVSNGFKSRREVIAERGYDAAAVDAELAADRERAEGFGLTLTPTAAATLRPNQEAPEE